MHLSGTVRRVIAVAIALQASLATTVLGAGGADAAAGCAGVTGHLVDNGTTVTAVFHVPTTCAEVSVLSWIAPDSRADSRSTWPRKSADNVAAGDYQWTIAAPPAECFRQLDLRVPGRNVDSIVGGENGARPRAPTPLRLRPAQPDAARHGLHPLERDGPVPRDRRRPLRAAPHPERHLRGHRGELPPPGRAGPTTAPRCPSTAGGGRLGPGAHTESVALPPASSRPTSRLLPDRTGCSTPRPEEPVPAPR